MECSQCIGKLGYLLYTTLHEIKVQASVFLKSFVTPGFPSASNRRVVSVLVLYFSDFFQAPPDPAYDHAGAIQEPCTTMQSED